MRRPVLVVAGVAVFVAVAAGAWLLVWRQGAKGTSAGPVAMSRPLPEITGASITGATVDTAALRGKVAVINVWATWCGPCRREQPALVRLADRYAGRVRFLGINYNDDRAAAARWAKDEFGVPYPSLFDPHGRTASQLGYPYLPDTYVVDRSGTIRWAVYGETNEQELAGLIERVLAQGASPATPMPAA